ncbi:SRPBCC family protein [Rhizobium sp. Root1220]|uniref:SRPBCC family protein n=1 Tax=Rhizobium sp. Root1220 TaxID=1736432 RepID=UPI0007008B81|nr:SRPBCC family protein [Rhizobium sp. Root1220]KQV66316.1 hypothetical protein ASC90_14135 [Rhizobium sp. Root1220]
MDTAAESYARGKTAEPYGTMLAPETVRIERLLPGPIERVWSYLTDSDKRAKWFAGGPMELRQGGAVSLTFRNSDLSDGETHPDSVCSADGVDHVMTGVITKCEPPRLLSFNWSADGTGTDTTFELSQEGPDTRLVVTHRRIPNRMQLVNMSAGWHVHIGILIDLLSETTPRRFWPEQIRLMKVYQARFAE